MNRFVKAYRERIAIETGAAVLLCAHPSREGLKSGEGSGGSTAWNNALRARLYLRREKNDHGEEADPDYRELELMKANFARTGSVWSLRFEDGVFVPCDGPVKTDRKIANQDLILAEVSRAFDAGEPWSGHPQARGRSLGHWIMRNLRKKSGRPNRSSTSSSRAAPSSIWSTISMGTERAFAYPNKRGNFACERAAMKRIN